MKFLTRTFISWLPLGVAITLVCALGYATVQQNYRQNFNDPQIQMAEDAANAIKSGVAPGAVVSGTRAIDIGESLAPWIAVFDASGSMIVSSGSLGGSALRLPSGVFDTTTWHTYAADGVSVTVPLNEDRFTWQPRMDVRQAVVLIKASSSQGDVFVASGRNMREVESRQGTLAIMVGIGWVVTLIATFLAKALAEYVL